MTNNRNETPPTGPKQPNPEPIDPDDEGTSHGFTRYRGNQKTPTKMQLTVRLDRDLVDKLKEGGRGWQTRLNDALRSAILPGTVKPKDQILVIQRVIVDPEK